MNDFRCIYSCSSFFRGLNGEGEEILVAPKFSSTLRSILRHLCKVASPKEALLAIVGGLEIYNEDGVAYSHLIDPLSHVLSRMNEDNQTRCGTLLVNVRCWYDDIHRLNTFPIILPSDGKGRSYWPSMRHSVTSRNYLCRRLIIWKKSAN